ncbi:hypothetical protein B0H17DRAFT_1196015 [Mycena rosella]|uniref:Uncharacterized protein n=1 Tax=Mycena rosella TaxID=1033263 RepID=A0AAD7DVB0_MYCRO|nr:hypothetical protein B0H17DRAFT_1196015 [Mycena rosella]
MTWEFLFSHNPNGAATVGKHRHLAANVRRTINMLVARLARTAQSPALRQLHTTARLRSGHGDYNHLPFKAPYQGASPVGFGVKMALVLSFGFAIPFVAVQIQHMKNKA